MVAAEKARMAKERRVVVFIVQGCFEERSIEVVRLGFYFTRCIFKLVVVPWLSTFTM